MPVWISSKISNRPCALVSSRNSHRKRSVAGQTPASPWTGSSITPMVLSDISRFTESSSLSCALGKPGTFGSNSGSDGFFAGGRHRRQRPAVKRAVEGDDLVGAVPMQRAVSAGEFDGALIGFAAGIGEEHLIETTQIGQRLGQFDARHIVKRRARRQQQ